MALLQIALEIIMTTLLQNKWRSVVESIEERGESVKYMVGEEVREK